MSCKVEQLTTEVLVIGGGIAGAMAALQAREQGAEVLVLEAANTYRSGNAGSGIDHLYSYVPPVHEKVGYTKEEMKEDMAAGGAAAGLADREITDHFVDVSYDRIIGLEKYGLKFRFEDSHLPEGFRLVPQFHSIPTSFNFEGRDLKVKLTEAMKKAGVRILNHAPAIDILKDEEGNAAGALALSSREDVLYAVHAEAVIIAAAGGAGRLTVKDNTQDDRFESPSTSSSGFSIFLGLQAGAELANLEFLLEQGNLSFFGFSNRVGSPGSSWWPAARAVDDDGEVVVHRVCDHHIDEPDYKEVVSREYAEFMKEFYDMGPQILSGRQLYMDFDEASEKEVEYIKWSLSHEGKMWLFIRNLERAGVDLKKVKIPYQYTKKTGMHGRGTGLWVNKRCETSVRGLYAAGDCRGVTGGSGPMAVVSGYEAGLQAAKFIQEKRKNTVAENPELSSAGDSCREEKIRRTLAVIQKIRENPDGESWQNAEKAVRGVMLAFGTLPLTDTKIARGRQLLRDLENSINLKAEDPHELARCWQVISLLQTAKAIFAAAEHRDESFAGYQRAHRFADLAGISEDSIPKDTVVYSLIKEDEEHYCFTTHDYRSKERGGSGTHGKAV